MYELNIQKYLREHGLDALVEEFAIRVRDYPDRVVLNYSQIDSPKFHPICDEARGLILRKGSWDILAQLFQRFYNLGEGDGWQDFPMDNCRIDEKRDGSIMAAYHDGKEWCVSSRGMAYAEGNTFFDITFRELFNKAATHELWSFLEATGKQMVFIFELTSMHNRVVTRYNDTELCLIGCRNRLNGFEVGKRALDSIASDMGVLRPKSFEFDSLEAVLEGVNKLPTLDEGFVLVHECEGSFRRLKVKSKSYLAIHGMRENGLISPKNILTLLLTGEEVEYLSYFEEDRPYFDFCKGELNKLEDNIADIWKDVREIEDQKEFAMTIIPRCNGFEKSFLFRMRKGEDYLSMLRDMGGKKLSKAMNMKQKFISHFPEFQVDND